MKKALLYVLSILFVICTLISCEHNVYIDEGDTSMDIWAVGERDALVYFSTANEAIEYIIGLNARSVTKTEDKNRTVTLMRPVLAENSDGIEDESYEKYVADESLRGNITVPEGFTGDLCIDFNNCRYDFANSNEAFFVINGGDNVYIYNGTSVIFNEASHVPYAIVVDTKTVTIDEHLLDDRRTDPNAVHVKADSELVITASRERENTYIKGDLNVEGSLSIGEGVIYIESIETEEDSTFEITGGEIHNPHEYDDVVLPAINKEEFEKNGGEHNYIHAWNPEPFKVEIITTPTCKEKGLERKWYKCTECDAEKNEDVELEKVDHDHSGAWDTTDGKNHWRVCPVCEERIDEAKHTFSVWTYSEKDLLWYRHCTICLREEENAHEAHYLIQHLKKDPTCTEDGNTEYWECSICGECFSDAEGKKEITKEKTVLEKLGHDWNTTWSGDENTHWKACKREGCIARNEEAEHTNEYIFSALTTLADGTPFLTISHRCIVCERSVSSTHEKENGVFHITPLDGFAYSYNRSTGIATVKLSSAKEYTKVEWYDINGKEITCLNETQEKGFAFTPDGKYGFRCELIKEEKVIESCYIEITQYKE